MARGDEGPTGASAADRRRSGAGGAFVLLTGVALGVLVSALVIPSVQDTTRLVAGDENAGLVAGRGPAGTETGTVADEVPEALTGGDGSVGGSTDQRTHREPTADSGAPVGDGASDPADDGSGDGSGGPGSDSSGSEQESGNDVRGVTGDSIEIGVAVPDLGAVQHLSPEFDIGDAREQMEAVLDGWEREGHVPVHGRNVQFVYRQFDIFSGDEQTAACNGFVKDDEVFAVIGVRYFEDGARCLAGEHDTPVVGLNSVRGVVYEETWPYYATVRTSLTKMFRNWVHWADQHDLLAGHRLGIYYETPYEGEITNAIELELEALGYTQTPVKVEAGSGEGFGGGSRDSVAVQQFSSEGVDVLMPILGATQFASFMQQAEAQGYRPTYLGTDFSDHTSDATASLFPADQYDGTLAMTSKRVGAIAAGSGPHPRSEACVSNYERYSGQDIPRESPESAEYEQILVSCDGAHVMLEALRGAGRQLDRATLMRGLDDVDELVLPGHGDVTYSSSERDGVAKQRTAQWQGDCGCWVARGTGEFEPYWVS